MSLSPALQQSFTSQQAPSWLLFCGALRVIAAVETARVAVQARLIKSTLNFFISASPNQMRRFIKISPLYNTDPENEQNEKGRFKQRAIRDSLNVAFVLQLD
jgi:hypothetical protein